MKLYSLYFVIAVFVVLLSNSIAKATDTTYESVSDLRNYLDETEDSTIAYYSLKDMGYIKDGITFEDFDYIFVLTNQLVSTTTNRVSFPLALSVIAVESRFDANAKNPSGAKGLMQLMTIYHSKRMGKFVEVGHQVDLNDFFDPRLNIVTGLDYLDELLEESSGCEAIALTKYNQGTYRGCTSRYAKGVLELSYKLETILDKEDVYVPNPS